MPDPEASPSPRPITPLASVCIVNWNTRDHLRLGLETLEAATPSPDIEIVVIDNASDDGSAEMVAEEFPHVKLLAQTENLMFGPGANEAARHASGDYVVILNADVRITPDQVRTMARYMAEHPRVGACSVRELDAHGRLRDLPRPPPTVLGQLLKLVGLRRLSRTGQSDEGPQPALGGACLMLRRDLGEQLGYFDPATASTWRTRTSRYGCSGRATSCTSCREWLSSTHTACPRRSARGGSGSPGRPRGSAASSRPITPRPE